MLEEVSAGIYRAEIPLPGNPLRAVNAYLLRGDGRWLVVDTGMNRPECRAAMEAAMGELAVDCAATDYFITHLHADHLGLVSWLARAGCRVYFNRPDAAVLRQAGHWERLAESARRNGFPEAVLRQALARHPGRRYQADPLPPLTLLREGDRLAVGAYEFTCVETPGHTPGHLCLLEARARILFSGDHVLQDITPNLSGWTESRDGIREYLASLTKIADAEVDWVFPGHRRPFQGLRTRVAELERHHQLRAAEVLAILGRGDGTAYQVAAQMTWDIRCAGWEEFPPPQQWFATGEALAHLVYLQGQGRVAREVQGDTAIYRLVS